MGLPKIKSYGELKLRARTDLRYQKLAMVAASNLGQPCETYKLALQSLDNMMMETTEKGTLAEINFVRDLVKDPRPIPVMLPVDDECVICQNEGGHEAGRPHVYEGQE